MPDATLPELPLSNVAAVQQTEKPLPAQPAPNRARHAAAAVEEPANTSIDVRLIRRSLIEEVIRSRGGNPNGTLRTLLEPLVARSIDNFVKMMAEVDRLTAAVSFQHASAWMLTNFARGVEVIGAEQVPTEGPMLLLANHPGNFDEVVIAATVTRPDLRIFANDHPVLTQFPYISRHAVFSKADDPLARMNALRTGIRNLREGSSLLLFPTGRTDPDPRRIEGAGQAIENWSPSVELIVKKAPETQVVVALVSGVVSRPILNSPFVRFRKQQLERQKLAGTIQMALQMLFPRWFNLVPRVTFSAPFVLHDLKLDGDLSVQQAIIRRAQALLHLHTGEAPLVPPTALSAAG